MIKMTFNQLMPRLLMKLTYQDEDELYLIYKTVSLSNCKQRTFNRRFRLWRETNPHDEKWFDADGGGRYKKYKHKEA